VKKKFLVILFILLFLSPYISAQNQLLPVDDLIREYAPFLYNMYPKKFWEYRERVGIGGGPSGLPCNTFAEGGIYQTLRRLRLKISKNNVRGLNIIDWSCGGGG